MKFGFMDPVISQSSSIAKIVILSNIILISAGFLRYTTHRELGKMNVMSYVVE